MFWEETVPALGEPIIITLPADALPCLLLGAEGDWGGVTKELKGATPGPAADDGLPGCSCCG